MKFFVDTANVEEIRELMETGLLDGVTTNPSLVAQSGQEFTKTIAEICSITDAPVSAEVAATETEAMIEEGTYLASIAPNVVVKLPLTFDGLRACAHFSRINIKTNLTLCFSANQALLAAKSGATYVSPFIGRVDDINIDGIELIRDIRAIFDNYAFETKILAASIRSVNHVSQSAVAGADVATIPPTVIRKLAHHPLTDKGLKQFVEDWKSTGQTII
ncbi:fructose-6-phosphate aldolase [Cucumibacter marinus]|uniref:fructose-6-phosphate aldolase n=1 Tax=Cucumibacter marinus TaxID=1121252 RepID=UPI0003FA1097|nr:fructose-6-phosphate aldolase [Cucumibacter marinus]